VQYDISSVICITTVDLDMQQRNTNNNKECNTKIHLKNIVYSTGLDYKFPCMFDLYVKQ
jgi:hypothetical protein